MTPQEIFDRYLETPNTEFLNELKSDDLWAFLEAEFWFPNMQSVSDYFRLHDAVVAQLKIIREVDADYWQHKLAGTQYIRDHREEWIAAWDNLGPYECYPTDLLLDIFESLKEV